MGRRKEGSADKTWSMVEAGKWAQSRNFAGRVSFYGKTFSDTRRRPVVNFVGQRLTAKVMNCETCATAFRKLPDENIQWPPRCSIATDNRIKRRKCGPWERYLPPTSYEINGSRKKKKIKKERNERKRAERLINAAFSSLLEPRAISPFYSVRVVSMRRVILSKFKILLILNSTLDDSWRNAFKRIKISYSTKMWKMRKNFLSIDNFSSTLAISNFLTFYLLWKIYIFVRKYLLFSVWFLIAFHREIRVKIMSFQDRLRYVLNTSYLWKRDRGLAL